MELEKSQRLAVTEPLWSLKNEKAFKIRALVPLTRFVEPVYVRHNAGERDFEAQGSAWKIFGGSRSTIVLGWDKNLVGSLNLTCIDRCLTA